MQYTGTNVTDGDPSAYVYLCILSCTPYMLNVILLYHKAKHGLLQFRLKYLGLITFRQFSLIMHVEI